MEPNHAILRQSYEPRFTPEQENWRDHVVNADGYGIGWFRESDATPFLYRAACPPWNDCNLADMVDFVESRIVLAHVRAIKPFSRSIVHQLNCHPFRFRKCLWMHNGDIKDIYVLRACVHNTVDRHLVENVVKGTSDSELVFAIFMHHHVIEQSSIVESMRTTLRILREEIAHEPCSMNFVVATPDMIVGTRAINSEQEDPPSLYYYADETCCMLCSEPTTLSGANKWTLVPKNHLLHIDVKTQHLSVEPL